MSDWKRHAEAALVDINAALTGKSENAAAALEDAVSNLNRAIGDLDFGEPTEEEDESEA
jgi:hypothetical protein